MLDCQMEQFLNLLDSSGKDSIVFPKALIKGRQNMEGHWTNLCHIQTNQSFCFYYRFSQDTTAQSYWSKRQHSPHVKAPWPATMHSIETPKPVRQIPSMPVHLAAVKLDVASSMSSFVPLKGS